MSTVFKKPSQAQLDSFKNRDVLSAADLTKEDLEIIMNTAGYYEQQLAEHRCLTAA